MGSDTKGVAHHGAKRECYVWRLLDTMHKQLPHAAQLEYLHSLKRLEVIMAGAPIARWAAFTGSGVSSKATHVLCEYLRAVHDINLKVSTDDFAESDSEKRTFLMEHFP